MKLGGSLGNVPQKFKKICYVNTIYFGNVRPIYRITERDVGDGT
jgi:hypothetical protein